MSILHGLEAPVHSFIWLRPGPGLKERALCGVLATVRRKEKVANLALEPKATDSISWSKQQALPNGAL